MGRFDTRTRVLIGAVCLFAVAAALIALRLDVENHVVGTDRRIESVSAIGNRAFMRLLELSDIPVEIDRSRSVPASGGDDQVRIVMANLIPTPDSKAFLASRLVGPALIVVLPKWEVTEDPLHPGWVASAVGLPVKEVVSVLRQVVPRATVERPEGPIDWTANELGYTPTLAQPQLFGSRLARPILASDDGMLIGEMMRGNQRIWVVADPDLIANHGLHRGDNAALALAMVEAILPADGEAVFDVATPLPIEPPSIERLLFTFPTAIVSVEIAIMCLLLLWAAAAAFGTPLDLARPIATGSAALIANMSALLILGGHLRQMLARYGEAMVRDVAHRLHAPHGLNDRELGAWLARIETARGVGTSLARLRHRLNDTGSAHARADARHVMALAAAFHQWRQEMIGGPGHNRGR